MKSEQTSFFATLRTGQRYTLLVPHTKTQGEVTATIFSKDQPVPVSNATKAYLERHAVRNITIQFPDGKTETRQECQFDFEPVAGSPQAGENRGIDQ